MPKFQFLNCDYIISIGEYWTGFFKLLNRSVTKINSISSPGLHREC